MSKLSLSARVPKEYNRQIFTTLLGQAEQQVNGLSEGRITNRYSASTAAPTTGDHARGDIVWHSEPSEAGGAGSMYVVIGWIAVAAGTPGTWVQMRTLTGN